MKSSFPQFQETDMFFAQMENDKDNAQKAFQYILSTIDEALDKQNHDALMALIPYIEEGEGQLAFQYIGKTHRLHRILRIIELEQKYCKISLSTNCKNSGMLLDKYLLTLFAFRRLIFQLSSDSVAEAIYYLQNNPISHFAAYIITQDELILPTRELYETLTSLYAEFWTNEDIQQFLALAEGTTTPN